MSTQGWVRTIALTDVIDNDPGLREGIQDIDASLGADVAVRPHEQVAYGDADRFRVGDSQFLAGRSDDVDQVAVTPEETFRSALLEHRQERPRKRDPLAAQRLGI